MNSKVYKWCAVPLCKNTSIATPNKLFVYVPNKKNIREKWLKLARRDPKDFVTNSPIHFCEDHFDMPNDMENYMQYHLMGSVSQVRMKPGCFPKKFACQPDRKTSDTIERPYIICKKRKMMAHKKCEKYLEQSSVVTEHLDIEEIVLGSSGTQDEESISTMTSTDTYQLKWHSHSAHLNGSVAALLRSERFTDVVLCTMDGSQIPAHKFILSSCSVYLSSLFDGQRSVMRMSGMLYVVLPSEISSKALKILVEYMYKGETTVSNEILDTVLKAGEVLKIRGLWRQLDEAGGEVTADKTVTTPAIVNKQVVAKKPEELPKIAIKKDDKVIKFNQVQTPGSVTRPMFIGPPKLVFIKTTEGGTQAALRPGTALGSKGQTILVAPAPITTQATLQPASTATSVQQSTNTVSVATPAPPADDAVEELSTPRILRRSATERKYGKRQKTEVSVEETPKEPPTKDAKETKQPQNSEAGKSSPMSTEIMIKDEPEWDASSIEEEERSIAEMFQAEMNVKSEPIDEVDIDEDGLMYSPLACELCAEVFTVPAAWVRHVQAHARDHITTRKRKTRSDSDDTEETMALLRCDLCQKHFPNPGEWVRHIQSTHTETDS